MERLAFERIMAYAAGCYPKKFHPDKHALESYWLTFAGFEAVRFLGAVAYCVKTSKFFPTVKDLLDAYTEGRQDVEALSSEAVASILGRTAQPRLEAYSGPPGLSCLVGEVECEFAVASTVHGPELEFEARSPRRHLVWAVDRDNPNVMRRIGDEQRRHESTLEVFIWIAGLFEEYESKSKLQPAQYAHLQEDYSPRGLWFKERAKSNDGLRSLLACLERAKAVKFRMEQSTPRMSFSEYLEKNPESAKVWGKLEKSARVVV